jgi:D-alanine-D-alanine ligase
MLGNKNIALIAGGWSREREISLKGGKDVFEALDRDKYEVEFFDPATDLKKLIHASEKIDLAFILLHGAFGEDGRIQGLLDILRIPYVGSGVLASAMCVNKKIAKGIYRNSGLCVAEHKILKKGVAFSMREVLGQLGRKVMVKPLEEGSSLGMSMCENEGELAAGIDKAFGCGNEIMVEEYIEGREVTCCVIGGRELETLPLIEIVPDKTFRFFDFAAKYTAGATREVCPAPIENRVAERVRLHGMQAHQALGCKDWSRTDMIVRGTDIYLLETNTIPGMTQTSLFPLAARTAGMNLSGLLDKLISTAMDGLCEAQ